MRTQANVERVLSFFQIIFFSIKARLTSIDVSSPHGSLENHHNNSIGFRSGDCRGGCTNLRKAYKTYTKLISHSYPKTMYFDVWDLANTTKIKIFKCPGTCGRRCIHACAVCGTKGPRRRFTRNILSGIQDRITAVCTSGQNWLAAPPRTCL